MSMPRSATTSDRKPREAVRQPSDALSVPGPRSDAGPVKATRPARTQAAEERRSAILAAALEEFTARGYEGARLDDVAKRAGIAKGTIYLYFADKEALFQDLVRSMVHPVLGTLEHLREVDIPARVRSRACSTPSCAKSWGRAARTSCG